MQSKKMHVTGSLLKMFSWKRLHINYMKVRGGLGFEGTLSIVLRVNFWVSEN